MLGVDVRPVHPASRDCTRKRASRQCASYASQLSPQFDPFPASAQQPKGQQTSKHRQRRCFTLWQSNHMRSVGDSMLIQKQEKQQANQPKPRRSFMINRRLRDGEPAHGTLVQTQVLGFAPKQSTALGEVRVQKEGKLWMRQRLPRNAPLQAGHRCVEFTRVSVCVDILKNEEQAVKLTN